MTTLPVSEPAARPRLSALAPWQAAALAVGVGAIAIIAIVAPTRVIGVGEERLLGHAVVGLLGAALATVGTLGVVRLAGLAPAALFLRPPDRCLVSWGGVGLGLAAIVLGAALVDPSPAVSLSRSEPTAVAVRLVTAAATGLWSGTVEELLLRGVLLGLLGHRWRWDGAILATAMLFGIMHTGAGTTWVGTLLYVLLTAVAGLLLGLLVVATGNVWNAVALHAGWNAAFARPLLGLDPAAGTSAVVTIRGDPGWLLGAGRSTLAESPLAILLFAAVLFGYWTRLRRRRGPH